MKENKTQENSISDLVNEIKPIIIQHENFIGLKVSTLPDENKKISNETEPVKESEIESEIAIEPISLHKATSNALYDALKEVLIAKVNATLKHRNSSADISLYVINGALNIAGFTNYLETEFKAEACEVLNRTLTQCHNYLKESKSNIMILIYDLESRVDLMVDIVKAYLNNGISVFLLVKDQVKNEFILNNTTSIIDFNNLNSMYVEACQIMQNNGFNRLSIQLETMVEIMANIKTIPSNKYVAINRVLTDIYATEKSLEPIHQSYIDALASIASHKLKVPTLQLLKNSPQRISEVCGLNQEAKFSIKRLIRRFNHESIVSQGVVLYGPPGTGKTMLAKLIAKESGRAYIGASCSDWMSSEHMGEHLSKINASFTDAIENAPSVMFLDELDSLGVRGKGEHAQYYNAIINALLEKIQTAIEANVAVIGATNILNAIDPAIIRPGRLGEHISIPIPDEEGIKELTKFFFSNYPINISGLQNRVGLCSPAKLSTFHDEIVDVAKENGRNLPSDEDVNQVFYIESLRLLNGRDARKIAMPLAVGLCAKARMARLIWGDDAQLTGISMLPGLVDLGRLEMPSTHGFPSGTVAEIISRLHFELSPAAGRRALAIKKTLNGNEIEASSCFSELNQNERIIVSALIEDLERSGFSKLDNGSDLKMNIMHKMNNDNILLKEAWKVALNSALKCIDEIELAAKVLVKNSYLDLSELKYYLFGELETATVLQLH